MNKKSSDLTTGVAVVLILGVALVVFMGRGQEVNRIGLELVLHYKDGTSRTVDAPVFADLLSLQMVWDGTAQVNSIDVNMLVQNTIQATSMTYSCVYEVKFDSVVKRNDNLVVNVGTGGTVKYAALTTVTETEILGWAGQTNGTHTFEVNVPVGSNLVAQTSDGLKAYQYAGQIVSLPLTVDNNITTGPPINPPPPASTSITLYTETWNAATGVYVYVGNVPVTVSWTGGSATWTTASSGYITQNVSVGTYTFSATYNGNSNTTSLTVASGDAKSATLFFGGQVVTPPPVGLFNDGFEGGDLTRFTATRITSGTATVITSATAFEGTHVARFTLNGVTLPFETGSVKESLVSPGTQVYTRAYVKMVSTTTQTVWLLSITDSGGSRSVWAGINSAGLFCLRIYNGTTYVTSTTGVSGAVNTWHCLELYMNRVTGGGAKLYVDGSQAASLTADLPAVLPNADCYFGVESTYSLLTTAEVNLDAVVINTSYIGP